MIQESSDVIYRQNIDLHDNINHNFLTVRAEKKT